MIWKFVTQFFFFRILSSVIDSSKDSEILTEIISSTEGSIIKHMKLHVPRILKALELLTVKGMIESIRHIYFIDLFLFT